ncbi:cytochrome c [Brevundimonas sp.]|uniref:c-type cytochrome n=1 Tax=Brevundimonas sp. TaxID=1871086 RepID=UPI0025DD1593|nr:cytochrome c [Brevundimonas sp.]
MPWLAILWLILGGQPSQPPGPPAELEVSVIRGERMAVERCGGCHAVGADDDSPLAAAPPFRTIPGRYPVENLEEALAEGIIVAHDAPMPTFQMEPDEIADILAYMRTLDPADS